jgi:hypothetical protein
LVFKIIDAGTFKDLDNFMEALKDQTPTLPALFVVGNMADLATDRTVAFDDGVAYAKGIKGHYFETSAKRGDGIQDLFLKVAEECRDRGSTERSVIRRVQLSDIGGSERTERKKGCC